MFIFYTYSSSIVETKAYAKNGTFRLQNLGGLYGYEITFSGLECHSFDVKLVGVFFEVC